VTPSSLRGIMIVHARRAAAHPRTRSMCRW
jgi:hypothetical protein